MHLGPAGTLPRSPPSARTGHPPAGMDFVNPASTRGRICVLPREISPVQWASDGSVLGDGQPALNTVEKSAEGEVGRGKGSNPPSRLKARTVPARACKRGMAMCRGSSASHPTRVKLTLVRPPLNPGCHAVPCAHDGTTQSAEPPCT